jgi:multiple antibiotic resistance protein
LALLTAVMIHRILSKAVLTAMERLMGMILVVIAVQMTMDGWAMRFH